MKSTLGIHLVCALFSCTPAFAAVVQHDSQSSFIAAAGSVLTETFDSIGSDASFRSMSVSVGDLTLSGFGSSQDAFNIVDAVPSAITGFSINGTTQVTAITAPSDTGFTIRFAQPILGFGATFISLQAPSSLLRTQIFAAGSVLTPPLLPTSSQSFFGFVSDVPFSVGTSMITPVHCVSDLGIYIDSDGPTLPKPYRAFSPSYAEFAASVVQSPGRYYKRALSQWC